MFRTALLAPAAAACGSGRLLSDPRRLAVGIVAALLLIGCSGPGASAPPTSPTASGARTASLAANKAAALRMQIDLALSAHVMLLARTADAGIGVRSDEFVGYGTMVHEQTGVLASQLQDVSGSADTGSRAKQLLSGFDGAFLDYVTASFKQDANGQNAAVAALSGTYVPGMADLLAPITGIKKDQLTSLFTAQVQSAKAMADAEVKGGDWNAVFAGVGAANQGAATLGDTLVAAIAQRQSGRYPGQPGSPAGTLQAQVAMRLQEQVYLTGFAASAAVGNRQDELQAARAALTASQAEVAQFLAPIGSQEAAKVAPALADVENAVIDDALAIAGKNQAAQQQAETRLTDVFPGAFLAPARRAGMSGDRALALTRAVGQSLKEVAGAEGAKNYSIAPAAARDAAQSMTGLGQGVAEAMVSTYAGQFR